MAQSQRGNVSVYCQYQRNAKGFKNRTRLQLENPI